jgi:hypothetical protein
MIRKLHFSNEHTLYLILNIIAHDVIHDYGPSGGSEQRWKNNQVLVKQFTSDYYSFTNPLLGGNGNEYSVKKSRIGDGTTVTTTTDDMSNTSERQIINIPGTRIHTFDEPRRILKVKPRTQMTSMSPSQVVETKFPGTFSKLGQQPRLDFARGIDVEQDKLTTNYVNYVNTIKEMKNDINNTIVYTFFNHYLMFLSNGNSQEINYLDTEKYIVPLGLDNDYSDLFKDISNKFIGFCFINKIPRSLSYTNYLDILCKFLSSYATNQSIFENIEFEQSIGFKRKKGGFRYKSKGGKGDTQLSYEEANILVNYIDNLNKSEEVTTYLNKLKDIYDEYNKTQGVLTSEQKKEYENIRKLLIEEYQKIFLKFDQKKKSGSLYGDINLLPLIKLRFSYRVIDLIDTFYDKINTTILDYYKIIDEYNIAQEKIERKKLYDLLAEQQGDLTSMDKFVRQQFSQFIAKSGLFLTDICDNNGTINNKFENLHIDSALRKEINILLYIAEWTKNVGWQEIKNQGLDDELISYFIDNSPEIVGRYSCQTGKKNYVINNAAPISYDLKNLSFCPYSSILDGMSQCSWKSAQGNIEYGDMDFFITNTDESLYYNGKLIIDESNSQNIYPTNLNISFNLKVNSSLNLNGNKTTTINGIDLEAHFVLKNTLVNVINFILSTDDTTRTQIFAGGIIFENLFTLFTKNINSFNIVYSEILFKGTGDLFQEINCVSKFGGYTMKNYKIDSNILSMNTNNGEQLRLFAANDRPSGTRFIFILLNGNPNEINTKAMGGYYSKEKLLIVKHPQNTKNCDIVPEIRGGSKMKRNNRTKKNRNNRTKKRHNDRGRITLRRRKI